jgi:hypothetical protein
MDKHSFEIQQESLLGQQRVEKLRGLKEEVNIAKADADIKQYHAVQSRVKVAIASTESNTENIRLNQSRASQRLEQLKLQGQNQDIAHGTRSHSLRQTVLDTQFQGLQTDLSTAKKMLQNRRELLDAQGLGGRDA